MMEPAARATTAERPWWAEQPRCGFTEQCRDRFGDFATADLDVSIRILQQRAQLLAAVRKNARGRSIVRRAILLGVDN